MSPSDVLALAGLPATDVPQRLTGGDMGEVWRVGDLVVKSHPRPLLGQFPAEARGLAMLRQAGVRVPSVHWADERGLVLEYLPPGPERPDDLARQLAALHTARVADYGSDDTVFLGRFGLPPGRSDRWADVLRDHRLGPLVAATRTQLGPLALRLDRLLERLEVPEEGPVVVHGDLWAGNVHMCEAGAALIDPCAQRAERALDLAMMRLFGGFSKRFWSAYCEAAPIPAQLEESIALHQLVFLLVHVHFFGRSYLSGVARALDAVA